MARRTDRWGIGALVALALIGAAACGSDGDSAAATTAPTSASTATTAEAPPSTATRTTLAPSTTEAAEPTTTAEPSEVGVPLEEWIAAQEAEGRTRGYTIADGATDAQVILAYAEGGTSVDGGLLLASQRVIDFPDGISTTASPMVSGLGGRPVVVSPVDDRYVLWQLAADDATWSDPVDLGVFATGQSLPWVALLGDRLVVANQTSHDIGNGFYEPDRFEGVVVDDSLQLVPMAEPPAKQFLWITSVVRTHGLMLGLDSAADANAPLTQPWDYDVTTNEWTEVPIPDWVGCGSGCSWNAPHELGDWYLEVVVGDRVVKRLPDGSVGIYEPDTKAWTRVADAPFELAGPSAVVLGDQLAVAPVFTSYGANPAGTVGVLDLTTGTWATDTVDVGEIPEFGFQLWEALGDGTIAMFDAIHPEQDPPAPSEPDVVYDSRFREWRSPTDEELSLWRSLGGSSMYGDGMLRDLLP